MQRVKAHYRTINGKRVPVRSYIRTPSMYEVAGISNKSGDVVVLNRRKELDNAIKDANFISRNYSESPVMVFKGDKAVYRVRRGLVF